MEFEYHVYHRADGRFSVRRVILPSMSVQTIAIYSDYKLALKHQSDLSLQCYFDFVSSKYLEKILPGDPIVSEADIRVSNSLIKKEVI